MWLSFNGLTLDASQPVWPEVEKIAQFVWKKEPKDLPHTQQMKF